MKNQINWFEIPVANMIRAKNFYGALFGNRFTDIESADTRMAIFEGSIEEYGATGCLVEYEEVRPSNQGTVVYFHCENMDDKLANVESSGGRILIPKTDIGEHGYYAHIQDCEGNRIALHSLK